jgi:hypothetical protein
MKDEALKLVLEALEAATRYGAGGFENAKDALREAQAAQPAPVQEQKPYAYANPDDLSADTAFRWCKINEFTMPVYTTPPAAQPAVPDAFGTREGEHPQYVQGWNDCRAEMLKGVKP